MGMRFQGKGNRLPLSSSPNMTGDGISDELVTSPLQLPVVGREVDIRQQRRQRATLRLPNRILRLRPGLNP